MLGSSRIPTTSTTQGRAAAADTRKRKQGDDDANVGRQAGSGPLGVSELYDLRRDPYELSNAYDDPDYAENRDRTALQMLDWHIHTGDTVPVGEDSRGLPRRR